MSTIKIFFTPVREVATERGRSVLDVEVRPTFVKSGYLTGNIFCEYGMLIRIKNLQENQWNMKEEIRKYLQRTNLGLLVLKGIASC